MQLHRPIGMQVVSYIGGCPWVTASQVQLLVGGVLKGFFPASNPCGGFKNIRLSLACIPMALLKPYEVFLGPFCPFFSGLPYPGAPERLERVGTREVDTHS